MSADADRGRDLLDALDILVRHRGVEPTVYGAVHAAATAAIARLHDDLLDPRGSDFDTAVRRHAELARRLRGLPRPMTGQVGQAGGRRSGEASPMDPVTALFGRARGRGASLDSLLADMASGVLPQVERAVRDGLGDLFTRMDTAQDSPDGDWDEPRPRPGAPGQHDEADEADERD